MTELDERADVLVDIRHRLRVAADDGNLGEVRRVLAIAEDFATPEELAAAHIDPDFEYRMAAGWAGIALREDELHRQLNRPWWDTDQ